MAHTGTVGIGTGHRVQPRRPSRLAAIREGIRHRREERARRAYALRLDGAGASHVPGSEHTHILRRKAF